MNFGDALTPYIVEALSGEATQMRKPESDIKPIMLTGSILNWPEVAGSVSCGLGLANYDDKVTPGGDVRGVRGLLSLQKCKEAGYDNAMVLGDPALILPEIYTPSFAQIEGVVIGLIPHYSDYYQAMNMYRDAIGVMVINPLLEVHAFIESVSRCDGIASGSLHGLITAYAYDKPIRWIQFKDTNMLGDGFKFHDFYSLLGEANPQPHVIDHRKHTQDLTALDYVQHERIDTTQLFETIKQICNE